jgi:hypothetical protein
MTPLAKNPGMSAIIQKQTSQANSNVTVTIASIRAHGVETLLVYCNGKRDGDWPCNHQGKLAIDCFDDGVPLRDIERRCRCTACGWRRADLRPDYSVQQAARQSVGWVMPPHK